MQKLRELIQSITVHGVKYVFGLNFDKITRFFWTFSIVLSICGFFYYIYPAWQKLTFEPEISMITRERNFDEFPWPAITICPNVFARNKTVEYSKFFNSANLSEDECKNYIANLMWCDPASINNSTFCSKLNLTDLNVVDYIQESALSYKEVFLSQSINPQTTVLSGKGLCFTFNSLSYSQLFNIENIHSDFKQYWKSVNFDQSIEDNSTWSAEKGLHLANGSDIFQPILRNYNFWMKINPENEENFCKEKIFKIFIHKPSEIATAENEYYTLNYNEYKKVRLIRQSQKSDDNLRSYPSRSRKCYFEGEKVLKFFKFYTKSNCELECKANAKLKKCGCVLHSMPRDHTTRICNFDELKCKYHLNISACECYNPCNDLTYAITSEATKMESNLSKHSTVSNILFWIPKDPVVEIEQLSTYKTHNFISDFGSFLSLFMGCSLLSIVEVLYFIFIGLKSIILENFKQRDFNTTRSAANLRVIQVTSPQHQTIDDLLISLNTLTRTVDEIKKQNLLDHKKCQEKFVEIDQRFELMLKLNFKEQKI